MVRKARLGTQWWVGGCQFALQGHSTSVWTASLEEIGLGVCLVGPWSLSQLGHLSR